MRRREISYSYEIPKRAGIDRSQRKRRFNKYIRRKNKIEVLRINKDTDYSFNIFDKKSKNSSSPIYWYYPLCPNTKENNIKRRKYKKIKTNILKRKRKSIKILKQL